MIYNTVFEWTFYDDMFFIVQCINMHYLTLIQAIIN